MKPFLHTAFLSIALLGATRAQGQFSMADIQFWVGSGSDSAVLVVDFQDSTANSSYAWGYLFSGTATGDDLLNAVAAADPLFTVNTAGGFLGDLTYSTHAGIGGTGGLYWSTWTGTSQATFAMNGGIAEVLSNGEWFGCSFTDFNPAIVPGEPIAAPLPTGVHEVLAAEAVVVYPNPVVEDKADVVVPSTNPAIATVVKVTTMEFPLSVAETESPGSPPSKPGAVASSKMKTAAPRAEVVKASIPNARKS